MDLISLTIAICFGLAVTISGLIVTVRVRRRMKKSLGRRPTDIEIASLKTWIEVQQEEELKEAAKPIHPE